MYLRKDFFLTLDLMLSSFSVKLDAIFWQTLSRLWQTLSRLVCREKGQGGDAGSGGSEFSSYIDFIKIEWDKNSEQTNE